MEVRARDGHWEEREMEGVSWTDQERIMVLVYSELGLKEETVHGRRDGGGEGIAERMVREGQELQN